MEGFPVAPEGYLDAVGGQPLLSVAAIAFTQIQGDSWADPTSLHHAGRRAGLLLDAARASIASSLSLLGPTPVLPDEVHFASSVAEAGRIAVDGCPGPITVSAIETLNLLDLAEAIPGSATIAVDACGQVDADQFTGASHRSALACLQAANPEVGTLQPVASVGEVLGNEVPLLMDAAQLIGRSPIPAGWSILMAAGRDWGGPAGVSILVVRRGTRWNPPSGAERGWLGGFPDIAAAVSAATALEFLLPRWEAEAARAHRLINEVRTAAAAIPDVQVHGDAANRLPHVATFSVLYVDGELLVTELDRLGISVASGSACVSEESRPSHVLAAMGAFTGGNVRVSLPFGCTDETVRRFIEALPVVISDARRQVLGR
jgi:cysteine desulfurase